MTNQRRPRRRLPLLWWTVSLMAALTLFVGPAGTPSARAEGEDTKVMLLLDVSGSMNEKISSGGTKLAAAKRALKQVADALPAGTQVGLRVYGSEISEPKAKNPQACKDSELVMPVGPLETQKMYAAVDSFKAVGETPIAYSLGKAVEDLGDSGRRVLVLISDGEENCVPDPCPVAKKLAASGVDLQFNAVGLDVGSKARKQLQCIAEAGDGTYYDADEADDLSGSIRKITQRALRPFAVSGKAISGSATEESATPVTAGQYKDTFAATREPKFYRIDRRPGSTIRVSLAAIVTSRDEELNSDGWRLKLRTVGGDRCDEQSAAQVSLLGSEVMSVGAAAGATDSSAMTSACAQEPLLLEVIRIPWEKNTSPTDAELVIAEEPPILDQDSLPAGVAEFGDVKEVSAKGRVGAVAGGVSFSDAAELSPGVWSDTITSGETLVYKVPLQFGQRLRATVDLPMPKSGWVPTNDFALPAEVRVLSANRVQLSREHNVVIGQRTARLTASSPQVRVRNRESSNDEIRSTAVDGSYYLLVALKATREAQLGRNMRIRISVAVDGKASGQPVYEQAESPSPGPSSTTGSELTAGPGGPSGSVSATASPTDRPEAAGSGAGRLAGLVVGGLVLVGAATGVGVLIGRRRGRAG